VKTCTQISILSVQPNIYRQIFQLPPEIPDDQIISILIMPMPVPGASRLPHLASSVEATRSFLAT